MTRTIGGGGDCRKVVQIGGSGEGNLPRKALTKLSRKDTEGLFANLNNVVGTFADDRYKTIWMSALREFALPYSPWILETKKESESEPPTRDECLTCKCEITEPAKASSVAKGLHKPVSEFFRVSKTTKFKPNLSPSTTYRVIPRVADFTSVEQVIDCWRSGTVPQKGEFVQPAGVPLYKLMTSASRTEAWPAYSDKWWKASGNKNAYVRIKKIVIAVAKYATEPCNIETFGSDEVWSRSAKKCEENLNGKALSTLCKS